MKTETLGTVAWRVEARSATRLAGSESRAHGRRAVGGLAAPVARGLRSSWKAFAKRTQSMPAGEVIRGTNCMNAVDTNILVYFVDQDEPVKRTKAVALLRQAHRGRR